MAIAIAMMIVVVALVMTLGRMFVRRDRLVDEKPLAKQHRKIQEFEPVHEAPSIEELIEEEAADLGLHDIPGGEGIETSVKLRVWHRDGAARSNCAEGALRYEVDSGVDPDAADIAQVHLLCDGPPSDGPAPDQSASADAPPTTGTGDEDETVGE